MFVDLFANNNYFSADLHEGGISRVAQEDDKKDDDNNDNGINTDEDPEDPTVISLDTAAARIIVFKSAPTIKPSGTPRSDLIKKTQWNSQEWPHQKTR